MDILTARFSNCKGVLRQSSGPWATGCVPLIEQLDADFARQAEAYLSRVQAKLASEGITSKTEVLVDFKPASAIVRYAEENGIELLVLSSQGHSGAMRLVFGSVALRVLHDTSVPVFLVRPTLGRPMV